MLLLGLFAGACSTEPAPTPAPLPPASPAFDEAWRISTHNSYWLDRGVTGDLFASGTEERLADQLLQEHVRGLEIDIHKDPATPGAFAVYHTVPGNVLCDTLPGCLAAVRAFHHVLPDHEPLQITLELKEITASIFDATHTIEDLDHVLVNELGALLYRPADFMTRCPGVATLSACAKAAGWPGTHELRGRILVTPMGNWDGLGAQATKDYTDYALHGDIRDRAGFPMASSWQLDVGALNGTIVDLVTQSDLDGAFAQAVFMQVEDTTDPALAPFLARHGVVRMDGAVSADDQKARVALGTQLLQTDSPWVQYDDEGPSQPLRSLPAFSAGAMVEPGTRLVLGPGAPGERVFAYALETASTTAWETAVSSGVDVSRVGCLRAASAIAGDDASVTVCRTKIPASRGATPGISAGGMPDAERVIVTVAICRAGSCTTGTYPSTDPAEGGPGDLLRIEVSAGGDGGASCVRVRSAATAGTDLVPSWVDLGAPACFAAPLPYQGIATPASASGSFFGTRHERGGATKDARAADFDGVVAELLVAGAADGGVSDGGGPDAGSIDAGTPDGGNYREDTSLLVDDSSP